jgi:hypothetical protein
MAAFHLAARWGAQRSDPSVLDSEIAAFTNDDQRTTRRHLLELGRDLLRVAPAPAGHLCVQGRALFE